MEKKTRNSSPRQDLTGVKFNLLTPQYYVKGGKWHCVCDCGKEVEVDTRNLKSGHTKSCGCLINKSKNVYDMTKYEDENIKVIERNGSDNQQIALWKCYCKHCGNIFIIRGSSIRQGNVQSCGCVHSKNEMIITKLFLENNIEFATQYTFPDLKGKERPLRFDFAIFKNGILSHLIEYQGEQHFKKVNGTWGENYELNQYYDNLKREFCQKRGIKLIEIKFNQEYSIKDLI